MNYYKYLVLYIILVLLLPGILSGQGTGPRMMKTVYPVAERERDSITAIRIPLLKLPEAYRNRQLPATVDNSMNAYWPVIQDQYVFYTCQQYAGVAYVYSYEMNRLRNLPGNNPDNRFPALYTWNFMNQGERFVGVDFLQSFEAIRQQGHMTTSDYGPDTATSVLGWISGYDKYYRGMFNHVKQVYAIQTNSIEGINTLKNYLNDHLDGSATGGIACFTTSSATLNGLAKLPAGTPDGGKDLIPGWQSDPVHGLTVVGYNDSIRYDRNQDGKYTNDLDITGDGIVDARDWEIGGFRIANSYGTWWGNAGFAYALYCTFAMSYDSGGIWNNRVYIVDADTVYHPLLTAKVNLEYNMRNKIKVLAGVSSDSLDQLPRHMIDFPIFNFQGGEHAMQGNDTIATEKSIEFGLDVTSLLNYIPSGQPARFFLMVEEKDPDHIGQGKIEHASFISYRSAPVEFGAKETDVAIKDNNTTLVSVVATLEKPSVQITTTSLPPFTSAQPLQVQLEVTGGTAPYDWSFMKEYVKKPVNTPEPLVSGTSIQVHYETRSFASVRLPFEFPFFGKRYDSIYVNYFGFIAFTPQNLPAPYTTDETGMLRMFPLIVPSFSQQYAYMANKNDGIWLEADATHAVIRWKTSVSPYYTTSSDDFAVILYPDGRFEFCYGAMDNQGFTHTFYEGVSAGDGLNYDIQTQWNANDISGKSFCFLPPVVPEGLTLAQDGLLTVNQADSSVIYGLHVNVADARKISDSKVLALASGLDMGQELVCGSDARLKSGLQASLKLVLKNNGTQPIQDLSLKIHSTDSLLLISDSIYLVSLLNPGQSLTIPAAFSFRLRHSLPDEFPVTIGLQAQSPARTWKKELVFNVSAPEIMVESPCVIDGYNDRLDPGEVADLLVNVKNKGSLAAGSLQLTLVSNSPGITILSDPIFTVDQFEVFSSKDFHFQIKASRNAVPGSDLGMQLILNDSNGVLVTLDFNLQIGTKPIAVVNLSTSMASLQAMASALDSLHVGYDVFTALPVPYSRYASVYLILGTAGSGTHALTDYEASSLAMYLQNRGNLYMEGYYTWYYLNKTVLHPYFKYSSKKIPAFYYQNVTGVTGTFTEGMSYVYNASLNYAVFSFEPVAPAYATLTNTDSPAKNLEVVYHGDDYKTIGSMLDFSVLNGGAPPSSQTTMMQRYLEFFDVNIAGPFPLFHAATTTVCHNQPVTFTDDSFDNITTRTWEFQGGTPAASSEANPVVTYATPGRFDVKLTVTDGVHTHSMLKQKYIQVDYCSGSEDLAAGSSLFRIFPNPADGLVTIEVDRSISGSCELRLFDLAGIMVKKIQQTVPAGHEFVMNLSGLAKGLYFLKIQAGEFQSTVKLVKN